jgi:hypothetical protein
MRGSPPVKPTLDGALPLEQLAQVALPWLFGGAPASVVAPIPAFGDKMWVEIVNYIPAPVFMLAAVAVLGPRHGSCLGMHRRGVLRLDA